MAKTLADKAESYLQTLCVDIADRSVGSEGNRRATQFFADVAAAFGWQTTFQPFACMDWRSEGAQLSVGDETFAVHVSPYAPGGRARAPLVVAATPAELEACDAAGKILLLRGALTTEQLMPKNFPFYNPEEHRRTVALLETQRPQALVTATTRNPEMAGAVYPFPLIEDGDFDIPSVYMTEAEGARLAQHAGAEAVLEIRAERRPGHGRNVVVRKGAVADPRVVLFAHIDAKRGTPGAIDNAAGVVTLLLLAELLEGYDGRLGIEMVAMNGEDHYANPGEQTYLAANAGQFDTIALGVNLDGLGYRQGQTAYSLYGCPPQVADAVERAFANYADLVPGEAWYQSDHMLFLINERPAVAITSEEVGLLMREIVHTAADRPKIVDAARLVSAAWALRDLLLRLEATPSYSAP